MRPLLQVQVSRVWIIWCLFSGSHTLFDNSHAVRSLLQVQVSRVWNIWCLFLLAIFFLLIAASCVPLLQVQVSIVCNIWCLFLVAIPFLFIATSCAPCCKRRWAESGIFGILHQLALSVQCCTLHPSLQVSRVYLSLEKNTESSVASELSLDKFIRVPSITPLLRDKNNVYRMSCEIHI